MTSKLRRLGRALVYSYRGALLAFRQAMAEVEGQTVVAPEFEPTKLAVVALPAPDSGPAAGTGTVTGSGSGTETGHGSRVTGHGTRVTGYRVMPGTPLWENAGFWSHLDSFLKVQNSAHTRRAYETDLTEFLTFLKATGKPMNVHTLVEYREGLRTKTSSRTGAPLSHVSINRKMATLKSFLNWLVLNSVIPNNPAKAVKSFTAGRESPTRDIPNDRVRQMLELPARHKVNGRMHHAMLMVLFHLGLRRAELVGLRTSDLFEREGLRVIRVRGKGDKERVLPLTPELIRSLDTYLEMAGKSLTLDQPLFTPQKNNVTGVKDKALHPNAVAYVVKYYAKLAGVSYRVSPHSARATAVSNALDNLAPHRAVQHMAGWSSPLMVTRYDKRKEDLKNSAVRFVQYR